MINLNNYIEEKLKLNKDSGDDLFDRLIAAVGYAKREASANKEEYYVYKTEDSTYGVEENIDNYKIGDDSPNGTVVEIVKPR